MNIKVRTAAEQCAAHVSQVRLRERRIAADRAMRVYMGQMQAQFGSELAVTALVRYMGVLLITGAEKMLIQESCRHLAKCIARSVGRRLLTWGSMLH